MFIFLVSVIALKKEFNDPGKYTFTLKAGQYTVRCYGAQGGDSYSDGTLYTNTGGRGAYARGTMTVTGKGTTFYAFVGGKGKVNPKGLSEGGFNGGGQSGEDYGNFATGGSNDGSGGGGGATDLRINTDSLDNRIIVAAGGSGGSWKCIGAYGGKTKVICPKENNVYIESTDPKDINGNEGKGGNGEQSYYQPGSGGGGGYQGGRGGDWCQHESSSHFTVGCSGSSYISGYEVCQPHESMRFFNTEIHPNHKMGDGQLIVETDFECSSNCLACKSESICTKCFDGFYLSNGKCVEKCPSSQFPDSNFNCINCDKSCQSCTESSKHCTSCFEGSFLQDNKCVIKCNDGFAPIDRKCVKCQSPCKTCSSSPTECDSCENNYFKLGKSCVLNCPPKYIAMQYSCELCHGNCETCLGNPANCTSCKDGFYLFGNKCVSSCPNKMFALEKVCVNCKEPCDACNSYENCLTCKNGFYLYNERCYEKCPEGTSVSGIGCVQNPN